MIRPTVYLAGPISGLNYDSAVSWRDDVIPQLEDVADILSPMRNKEKLRSLGILEGTCQYGDVEIMSAPSPVFARDRYDVTRADLIFVNFLGAGRVSIGTVFEIGYAVAQGKLIVMVMEEAGNPHDHLFCTAAASIRVTTLEEGIYATRSFIGTESRVSR